MVRPPHSVRAIHTDYIVTQYYGLDLADLTALRPNQWQWCVHCQKANIPKILAMGTCCSIVQEEDGIVHVLLQHFLKDREGGVVCRLEGHFC